MNERTKLSVKGVWLIASLATLILPIFIPSGRNLGSPVEVAYLSMFLLSFPSSALALCFMFVIDLTLAFPMSRLSMMYGATILFFAAGLAQWFWLVPKLFGSKPALQPLELGELSSSFPLPEGYGANVHAGAATPLERVLREDESQS